MLGKKLRGFHIMRLTASLGALAMSVATASFAASTADSPAQPAAAAGKNACPDVGLKLPPGFCATVFADAIGHARHLVVAASGVVYVNTWSGRYYGNEPPHPGGFLVALQSTRGDGTANLIRRFGATAAAGGHGGTGIALYKGALYVEEGDRIERYTLAAGAIVPQGKAEVIVSGLPVSGDHPMHPFAIAADGAMYVDLGTATNSCQRRNRQLESPGIKPCTELVTRGGIWRYQADEIDQKFSAAARYATGIRNGEGIAFDASGRVIYATQHGRDQLHQNWPKLYPPEEEATQPAEQLLILEAGADYGWPECYFDAVQNKLVLAPEYGGDGGKAVGACADKRAPIAAFPAHWAPNDLAIYTGQSFPPHYRNGAFIAFHGSWDRAPFPQGGYNVVFQALTGEGSAARCEVFADGFAGASKEPGSAEHRPSGLAVAPDGALYIADDQRGRIYRVVYRGSEVAGTTGVTYCPLADAPAGSASGAAERPPEGVHADAGSATAGLPLAPGSSPRMLQLGYQVFHGTAGGAACTGCHGTNGEGTPLAPDLTSQTRLWSDGSSAGIARVIRDGVPQPKQYRSPMPPMGGAQLTDEQLAAVAAYVWALSHR
jgi:glucose/arabinose dehydrogenase/mono/diheme cytochrome c family protein